MPTANFQRYDSCFVIISVSCQAKGPALCRQSENRLLVLVNYQLCLWRPRGCWLNQFPQTTFLHTVWVLHNTAPRHRLIQRLRWSSTSLDRCIRAANSAALVVAMSTGSAALKALRDLRHLPLQGLRFRIVDAKGQVRDMQEFQHCHVASSHA